MQRKIILPWLICVALILLVGWLFFKTIDMSVTIDHQGQYAKDILKQRNLLAQVLNRIDINESESDLREMLQQVAGDSFFQKGNGHLVAEQVSFFFRDGKFVRVDVREDQWSSGDREEQFTMIDGWRHEKAGLARHVSRQNLCPDESGCGCQSLLSN